MSLNIRLQTGLKRLGFYQAKIDGIKGPKQMAAMSKYQVFKQKTAKGPDISHYQTKVDWSRLKTTADFIILRTSASTSRDKLFKEHWVGAGLAGLKRGVYHFFAPWQDANKQAELVLSQLGDRKLDIRVIADIEALAPKAKKGQPAPVPVSTKELIAKARVFLEALEVLTGHKPIIYTYAAFDIQHKLGEAFGKEYDLWIADYREGPASMGKGWARVVAHQWAGNNGVWDGVTGPCDCNYLEGSLDDITLPHDHYLKHPVGDPQ
jgi:lysozyme